MHFLIFFWVEKYTHQFFRAWTLEYSTFDLLGLGFFRFLKIKHSGWTAVLFAEPSLLRMAPYIKLAWVLPPPRTGLSDSDLLYALPISGKFLIEYSSRLARLLRFRISTWCSRRVLESAISERETAIELRNRLSIADTLFQNTRKCLKYGGPCRNRTCDHLIKSQMA